MRLVLVEPILGLGADNGERITRVVDACVTRQLGSTRLAESDLLVLPEHWCVDERQEVYEAHVLDMARHHRCHVVGGSQHVVWNGQRKNRGVVAGPRGNLITEYEKLRPYGRELESISAGTGYGAFEIDGHSVLVLLCADFWFFDLLQKAPRVPELVCVPALSVSRKPTPDYARALWRHMAVARAYELACFVGVSDWAHASELPLLKSSGVSGFVDPTVTLPDQMFQPLQEAATLFELDFATLHAFRQDRRDQGFLWQPRGS